MHTERAVKSLVLRYVIELTYLISYQLKYVLNEDSRCWTGICDKIHTYTFYMAD